MKINNIKFSIVIILAVMNSGVISALFILEIPQGNREVAFLILGSLLTVFGRAIADIWKKD